MFKPVIRYYEFRDQQNYSLEDICSFIERVPFERPFSWSVRQEGLVGLPDVPLFSRKGQIDKVVLTKLADTRIKVEIELDNPAFFLILFSSFFSAVLAIFLFSFEKVIEESIVLPFGFIIVSIYLPSLVFFMRWNQRKELMNYLEKTFGLDEVSIN
jgi:hypothetical protein